MDARICSKRKGRKCELLTQAVAVFLYIRDFFLTLFRRRGVVDTRICSKIKMKKCEQLKLPHALDWPQQLDAVTSISISACLVPRKLPKRHESGGTYLFLTDT